MNQSRSGSSNSKVKSKLVTQSPIKKRFVSKLKNEKASPRVTKIVSEYNKDDDGHLKKNKHHLDISAFVTQETLLYSNENNKGYETPKFKSEKEQEKREQHAHNFFSFGERERAKEVGKRRNEPEKDRSLRKTTKENRRVEPKA